MMSSCAKWKVVYGQSITRRFSSITDEYRQVNPTLRIHYTVKSRIPLDSLFNIRAFSSDSTGLPLLAKSTPDSHDHDHDHPHKPESKAHYNDITTILIPLPTLTLPQHEKLESFLETLLWESRLPSGQTIQGLDILRTKGYFKVGDEEYVVQGVTDIFEIKKVVAKTEGEEVSGKLVFIGRGVGEELRTAFDSFMEYQP
jgi:G3E family GTPase